MAQTYISWEDKSGNIESAITVAEKAAQENADALFFPEMSFTGFSMNTEATGEADGYTVTRMTEIAKSYNITLGFGWVEISGEKCKNRYSIIDNGGHLLSSYAKIHPFSFSGENEKFAGGDKITTYLLDGIPFTNFICYDLRFPELFRAVSDKVHAIVVPACWPAKRSEHWKDLLKARAIENQLYIFAVNCQGDIGGQYYSGDSCVVSPDGQVIEILSDKSDVLIYDFVDDVEKYRTSFPVLKDRRPDLYQLL